MDEEPSYYGSKNSFGSVSKNDEYYTPKNEWVNIKKFIPNDKTIWEPFNNVGNPDSFNSSKYLRELGFNVISKPYNPRTGRNDFFKSNHGDIVVSNPPFTMKREVLKRLKDLDKPFILILPLPTINTIYFRNMFMNDKDFGIIIPKKRIDFKNKKNLNSNCFECAFYCWKVGVKGIKWIE